MRRRVVPPVVDHLLEQGHPAAALHGDMRQRDRQRTVDSLKRGHCDILVATDVAARGLDIAGISHVFNFDLPKFAEDYVHRIGRTGRAGNIGHAYTFISKSEEKYFTAILKIAGDAVQEVKLDESFLTEIPKKNLKKERPQKAKSEKQTPSSQPKPKVQEEPKGPVVGFGDDIPAFMR